MLYLRSLVPLCPYCLHCDSPFSRRRAIRFSPQSSLLQGEQSPAAPQLPCWPLLDWLQFVNVSCTEEPQTGLSTQMSSHKHQIDGKNHFPHAAACTPAYISWCAHDLFHHMSTPLTPVQPVHQDTQVFFAKMLQKWSALSLCCWIWLFHHRCRILNLSLLNFTRFLLACFSSLLRPLWMAAVPFSKSALSRSSISYTNLLRCYVSCCWSILPTSASSLSTSGCIPSGLMDMCISSCTGSGSDGVNFHHSSLYGAVI